MSTTRARSRASFTAVSTGPLDDPPAARNTWSAPRPPVISASACWTASMPCVGGRRAQHRAGLLGQPAAVLDHVEPDDADPGGDQQPDHQLADEAQADHARGLAQLDLGAPHAVHGDRPDGGEGGMLGRDAPGDRGAQVDGDPVVLGVQGVLVAGRGDELADPELLGAAPHLDHHAAQRVAERRVGVEPVHDLLVGGHRALLRDRVEDLAHLVRPRPRLADHRHLGLGHLHHLGAGGDEREQRPHEDAAGTAHRGRHVKDGELAGFVVLRYLLHRVLWSAPWLARAVGVSSSLCRHAHRLGMAVPQLQRQQLPYLLGAVLAAGLLVLDEAQQRLTADHPASPRARRRRARRG